VSLTTAHSSIRAIGQVAMKFEANFNYALDKIFSFSELESENINTEILIVMKGSFFCFFLSFFNFILFL